MKAAAEGRRERRARAARPATRPRKRPSRIAHDPSAIPVHDPSPTIEPVKGLPTPTAQEHLLAAIGAEAERGELTSERLAAIAQAHGAPLAAVFGLYSFYFPPGTWRKAKVCRGLPCALRGNGHRLPRAEHPDAGDVSCMGYCANAPVSWNDGRYYTVVDGRAEEIEESRPAWVEAHVQDLKAYRDGGGYTALGRVLAEPDRASLVSVVESAVLRGMGGAGFPVNLKWKAVMGSPRHDRVVVVNAHEGEPGTFKDRLILEREPHRLLEGALIAASVVEAPLVVIALRKEYANAQAMLERALRELQAAARGLGFARQLPAVEIRALVGTYVTGEETALLEALEGRRSEPRSRPPFPAEAGLFGRPTLVQNVETLAALPPLLAPSRGAAAPATVSKFFCLTGDVETPGAYREPLGFQALALVESHGGTAAADLKAFLPGGLSGGLLPASKLDVELNFEAVRKHGCGLGTGAVVALGKDRCIVDVLGTLGEFFRTESCGKCAPCRLGTVRLAELFARLREGTASEEDLRQGEAVARLLQETSLCALGQVAGKPFLDAMGCLREEILAHTRGECPAGVCPRGGG